MNHDARKKIEKDKLGCRFIPENIMRGAYEQYLKSKERWDAGFRPGSAATP